jgi:hypothetical protein
LDDVPDGQIRVIIIVVFIVGIRIVAIVVDIIIIIVVAVAVVQIARYGQMLAEERLPTTVQFTIDSTAAASGSAVRVMIIAALRGNGNRHGRIATRRRIDVENGPRVARHGREFPESRSRVVAADQRGSGGGAAPPQTVHQRRRQTAALLVLLRFGRLRPFETGHARFFHHAATTATTTGGTHPARALEG